MATGGPQNIGILVAEAIDHLDRAELAQALRDVSIAIDATAKREFNIGGRKRYKDFIKQNMPLISTSAMPLVTGATAVRLYINDPDIKPGPDGTVGLEDILYHLLRCGLLHDWSLPKSISFSEETKWSNDGHVTTLPKSLIFGLIIAIVASPANKHATIPLKYVYACPRRNLQLTLNNYWGKRDELRQLFGLV